MEVAMNKNFSERFKSLRKESKLTQDQLAKKFYINKSSISRYENGQQIPELETLEKLASFFDVSIDYLLGLTDIRKHYSDAEDFLNLYIEEMKKSGHDLSHMNRNEIMEDIIDSMKVIRQLREKK